MIFRTVHKFRYGRGIYLTQTLALSASSPASPMSINLKTAKQTRYCRAWRKGEADTAGCRPNRHERNLEFSHRRLSALVIGVGNGMLGTGELFMALAHAGLAVMLSHHDSRVD